MPLSELLDEVFRLYRRYFTVIAGVSLVVVLPGLVWSLVTGTYRFGLGAYLNLLRVNSGSSTAFYALVMSQAQFNQFLVSSAFGFLGGLLFAPFAVGAVYRAATDAAQGRPATIASVLLATASRYLTLLGLVGVGFLLLLGFYVALVVGFLLLVIPGLVVIGLAVWMAVRWSMVWAAMLAEDVGPINALRRSWNLTRGHWWRILGILIVVAILQAVIGFGLNILFGGIAALIPGIEPDVRSALVLIVTTLLNAVVTPITTIAITLLYFDLRVRNEGYDLDQLAQQTGPAAS